MKKITLLFALIISSVFYAQGKLHIFNYSNHNINYTLWAEDENCEHSVYGYAVLRGQETITYNNFITGEASQGSSLPQIWYDKIPNSNTPVPYPVDTAPVVVFNIFSQNTRWKGVKFELDTPNGGGKLGSSCYWDNGDTFVSYLSGNNLPYTAYWMYFEDEYYVIIQ